MKKRELEELGCAAFTEAINGFDLGDMPDQKFLWSLLPPESHEYWMRVAEAVVKKNRERGLQ